MANRDIDHTVVQHLSQRIFLRIESSQQTAKQPDQAPDTLPASGTPPATNFWTRIKETQRRPIKTSAIPLCSIFRKESFLRIESSQQSAKQPDQAPDTMPASGTATATNFWTRKKQSKRKPIKTSTIPLCSIFRKDSFLRIENSQQRANCFFVVCLFSCRFLFYVCFCFLVYA